MSHCIIAIFSDHKGTWAEHTEWSSEVSAFDQLKRMLAANQSLYPNWVGWTYYDTWPHDGSSVKSRLSELTNVLGETFKDVVTARSMFKQRKSKFNVDVKPTQNGESQHNFFYAQITRKGLL